LKTVTSFPHRVEEIENVWIPMPDGVRLAARLWLPAGAREQPAPAILELIPYRKRDFTRTRDEPMHRWFAGHGYAVMRADVRGSGDSEGLLRDEYSPEELADAVALIAWIAAQPWSSGAVGMMGISWGGFNSLQVAALRPPALKAILTICSSDDRYADDAHYMGGCLLNENLSWGAVLFTFNALPPDPEIAGEGWRERWHQRLEAAPLFPAVWMRHPRRDAFWRRGSVAEDYGAIACPVLAVGGWADAYTNAVFRLLAGLSVPRRGLIGPWAHAFPHDGVPGPAIGFLQEARRWWDHWLRGIDTGIMDEPMLRLWMQESVPPRTFYPERPGRWVAEESWPSPRIETRRLHLAPGLLLAEHPDLDVGLVVRSPLSTGLAGGEWCGFGAEGEAPDGQREDDGKSLTFDSAPLAERLEILGEPVAELEIACDRPLGQVAVRLNDVAADGASTRVTYGLLDLAYREDREHPEPLVPGSRYRLRVALRHVAYAFPPGHRLRLAVSTCYWPIAWPSPEPTLLSLFTGASSLTLPVRPPRSEDAALPPFEEPEAAATEGECELHPHKLVRTIERDLTTNRIVSNLEAGGNFDGVAVTHLPAIDLDLGHTFRRHFEIAEGDPLSAAAENRQEALLRRRGWEVRIETRLRLTCTRDAYRLEAELTARENGEEAFHRTWDEAIPRSG
jgi:uncharacterized protein